jgi:pimeloyl-ACP methyl ester carboxylesterase
MPTLVVVGQHDMIRASHSRMLARNIRHAKLVVVPGAGHAVARKKPETFNRIALDFFQDPMKQTDEEAGLLQEQ